MIERNAKVISPKLIGEERGLSICNRYYKTSDGFFSYFVNAETGEKKFKLDEDDICVERSVDDFCREKTGG